MCGICGIVDPTNGPVDLEVLQSMARTMRHRGPDDEGYYRSNGVGLGFQGLSIIRFQGGRQPLANEDGSLQLVFNGAKFITSKPAQRVGTHRHTVSNPTDTEVLLHLYGHRERW